MSFWLLFSQSENRQFEVSENKQMKVHVLFVGRGLFVLIYLRRCLAVPQIEDKLSNGSAFLFYRKAPMTHIGKLIEEELRRQERTVTWLAGKLCCERTNVYSIFKRQSIDTRLLLKISLILKRNFFSVYLEELEKNSQTTQLPEEQ